MGVTPLHTPLAEYLFAQKSLVELGGNPLHPLTENRRKFHHKMVQKGQKIPVFLAEFSLS